MHKKWGFNFTKDDHPEPRLIITNTPSDITFYNKGEEFLRLCGDGQIRLGSNAKPDEAAQLFLNTLSELFPQWIHQLKNKE